MRYDERLTICQQCPERQGLHCTRHSVTCTEMARRTLRPCELHVTPPPAASPTLHARPSTTHEVDVVIPYCAADVQWLRQSVESILWQAGVTPLVHVVSDGGPLDVLSDLPAEVRRYQNLDAPIGPYRSVMRVWRWLQTPYVAIQDADDLALPHRLAESLPLLRAGADLVSGHMRQFVDPQFRHDQELAQYRSERAIIRSGIVWKDAAPRGCLIHGVAAYRRQTFETINGYAPWLCGADTEFGPRLQLHGYKVEFVKEVWGLRRLHRTSMTNRQDIGLKSRYREQIREELFRRVASWLDRPSDDPRQFGGLDQDRHSPHTIQILRRGDD